MSLELYFIDLVCYLMLYEQAPPMPALVNLRNVGEVIELRENLKMIQWDTNANVSLTNRRSCFLIGRHRRLYFHIIYDNK